MEKVTIKRNPLGDTRTATRVPTFVEFETANRGHVEHVRSMMWHIADDIKRQGREHDNTKINEPNRSLFYRELVRMT